MSRRPLNSSLGAPFSPFFHNRFFDDFDFDRPFRRPYWAEQTLLDGHRLGEGVGEVVNDGDSFSISVNVSHFKPEELKVNVCDNQLIIEGKHEEKSDEYGQVERHFVRKYNLPKNVKAELVTSELSKEGILTVQSQKKALEESKTRSIPIQPKE
uniref:SHSP domain-containing protein n=1 Tax=Steinernema glaseri TaxID=37863 RepID=A0A1I7YLW2_9BILA